MGLENLKRWQWIVIAVVLGGIVGYAREYYRDDYLEYFTQGDSIPYEKFAKLLMQKATDRSTGMNRRAIQDIVAHPLNSGGYLLTFKMPEDSLKEHPSNDPNAPVVLMYARLIAHGVTVHPDRNNPNLNIIELLEKIQDDQGKKAHPKDEPVTWSVPWIETGNRMAITWGVGTVLIIGGIWPTILYLMIGAGFGKPPKPEIKAPEYDLDRFKGDEDEDMDAQKDKRRKAPTDEDIEQVVAMNQAIEQRLMEDGEEMRITTGLPTPQPRPTTEVLKLTTTEIDETPLPVPAPGPQKEFGTGNEDFYPTEVKIKQKKK